MDYDDNEFQNHNLHLAAGEANSNPNKFPQSFGLPKFDFDDTLTEVFLGIEANADSNWIEDFSRPSTSTAIAFSSGATESCAISRHNNVWSEATSSESVEMLLNSVGQDEHIVRENTTKISQDCTMEIEPDHFSTDGAENLQLNPSVEDTPGESSAIKTDAEQEQALGKDASQAFVEESSVEGKNVVLPLNTVAEEAVVTTDHDKIVSEASDSLLGQTEDEAANVESRIEIDCGDGTVDTQVTCSGDMTNEKTLFPETVSDAKDFSDHSQSSCDRNDLPIDAQSVLVEAHSDSHTNSASEVENVEAEDVGKPAETDLREMETEPSNVTVVERGDRALTTLEVSGQDVSGIQSQDLLVSSAHTTATVESSLEIGGQSTTLTRTVSMEKPELSSHQQMEVIASGQESIILTETHTHIHSAETSRSIYIAPVDSMVASPIGGVSEKSDDNEVNAPMSSLKPIVELAINADDRDPDAKSSQIVSESVVSESISYVSKGSASTLAEPKSQPDTGKSEPMNDGNECEAFPLNPEEVQHLSQDRAPVASITSSIASHMVETSSDANERGSFSETEKVSSENAEVGQTVSHADASNLENKMDQQANQQSTQFVEECPTFEGSKDSVDADASGKSLLQQPEEKKIEENVVTEVENAPESNLILEKEDKNENPDTSSRANLGSEAEKDDREEANTAVSEGVMTTPVAHSKGDAMEIGESHASTFSEPSVKSLKSEAENPTTNFGTPPISSPAVKTSELQLIKTETNSAKKPEDQNISSSMSAGSPVLNRNETFSSGIKLTSGQQKAGDMSRAVNFSQAILVSQIVGGSPSTSSLEKTAAKPSRTKSERKPRRTSKSAGKETSKKGNNVKVDTHFQQLQSGGKTNAANQTSAYSIQITQSTEKQQNLQSPVPKAYGTFATPTASVPDLNSSALSSMLRRPFTDLQQVQLRSQIFVYGALIQGTAPDEAYMISAFGGPDGGKANWEKAWRACVARAQKSHMATPETPLQSRTGKTEISPATNPIIPLSSPLWGLSTSLDTLQSSSGQRGSAALHQPLLSSSHAHQTTPVTNIVGHNTPWMSPLPYRNPWVASPQTSGFDTGSRFPVFPITEPVKLTTTKESSLPYSGTKHVQTGTSSNVFKGTPTLEQTGTVVAPAQHSTGPKSRKRKKMPVSVEPTPSILNSLKQTELAVSPLVSISTSVPITTTPVNMASNAGTLPNVVSITASPMNLVSTFPGKKLKSSLPSPIFGGNLVPGNLEVKQRYVLSEDTIDKLKEAKMHAEDASALAAAAVSHSENVWKQIGQQRHAGLQPESQGRLASAAVAIAAAAAVAKAAAAAANVAANAALQAKLMAEEAALSSALDQQGIELPKSNDSINLGQGTPASVFKGEGVVGSSISVLIAAREASKKRVEAASAATKRAENMDSIVKAAELASEAVSQAGMLVSMGHPPSLSELVEAGPSNYWRQAQDAQPCKKGVLEKYTVGTSDGTFVSPRAVQTELDGSVRIADGVSGSVSATGKKTKGQKDPKGADLAKNSAVVSEPAFGSKSSVNNQNESEQIIKTTNNEDIKEGSNVEVFKEGPGVRTAWYSANVLRIEDDKAYVLFSDLSVEQGTDKLKDWVALKGEGDEPPKIRTARSITAMPYEGTRKRRRAAIGDPVWKIGDRVDSWVHDSWLEGVITEKNKNDENTVTVHFPAQGDTLTIKAWNLRPSLVWKDGRWIECSSSIGNISSSHEGDTPKEKRPRLGTPAPVAEVKDASTKLVDVQDLGKPPQTADLDLGVSENAFNIGRSTRDENKPDPLRMKRTGLQKPGSRVNIGGPTKPGKRRKYMDVHSVSEASTKTRERKEPPKPVRPIVPHNSGAGSWRMPSKNISREKQTIVSKPKSFRPAPKTKEKAVAAARMIPRKDQRNTTASNMESDDGGDQSGENKVPASGVPSKGTLDEQSTSSSQDACSKNGSSSSTNKGKMTPAGGRLAKIEEDKALAESSSKASDGLEPRRSNRRIQPTSRLLEGLQTSMMPSKIPSVSHSKSHQSQSKK